MKKLVVVVFAISLFMGCDNQSSQNAQMKAVNDSLVQIVNQRDNELNEMMSTLSDIQDGFDQINEAEGRVNLEKGNLEQSSKKNMLENLEFIQSTLKLNRELMAKLKQQLRSSTFKTNKLKKVVENLSKQLNEKQEKISQLQIELESKNIQLAEKNQQIGDLNKDVDYLQADVSKKAKMLVEQIEQLNTAWYVFGTKSELKDERIMQKGDVLKSKDFNQNYFTRIDIRIDKVIKLYSKSAKLLTNHPKDSYILNKDANEQYVLKITDYKKFWSVSKYLVILVK